MASVKVRPLYQDEIDKLHCITAAHSNATLNDALDSKEIFGVPATSKRCVRTSPNENRRARIHLCRPVLNKALAGSNGGRLGKLLGIQQSTMLSILNMQVVYRTEKKELVSPSEIPQWMYDYKIGPEILQTYIDEFDLDKAREECLWSSIAVAFMSDNKKSKVKDTFEVSRTPGPGKYLLCADYYISIKSVEQFTSNVKRGLRTDKLTSTFVETIFKNDSSRLSLLIAMKDKRPLQAMIMHDVVVLPIVYREAVDNREDDIDKVYGAILAANAQLRTDISAAILPTSKINSYKALVNAVDSIVYKSGKEYKSKPAQAEKLGDGKHGDIRKNCLGKRQDWSGRAVVVIDPFLSVNTVKIPETLIYKLLEFHLLKYYEPKDVLEFVKHSKSSNASQKLADSGLLNRITIMLGRQPTLHKHSIQGFKVEVTDGEAIVMNPLVCPGFNMDFDGDTAHGEVPITIEAVAEANQLIRVASNLYYSKTGACAISPRQDILYGLFICTRNTYAKGQVVKKFQSLSAVYNAVIENKIKVWDTVSVANDKSEDFAGHYAVRNCYIGGNINLDVAGMTPITSKNVDTYVDVALAQGSPDTFINTTNALVKLGFSVARLYPPSVSLLTDTNVMMEKEGRSLTTEEYFSEEMDYYERFNKLGLMTEKVYRTAYDSCLSKTDAILKDKIYDCLGPNNGYRLMAESGARGSKGNLIQMFSHKGSIAKNAREKFEVSILHPTVSQLNAMESFMAAQGGRKGQKEKSLETANTGYFSRKLWQASGSYVITNKDCGTTNGIDVSRELMLEVAGNDSEWADKLYVNAITGRYPANGGAMITKEQAKDYLKRGTVVKIRSPLTCTNPCCVKCFGIDPATHKEAVVGLPIGFIAATSIGEPGSQLTMKQFQKGGVASDGDVTSAFDLINQYTGMANLKERYRTGLCPTYAPLAPLEGNVTAIPQPDQTSAKVVIGNKKTSIIVPIGTKLRPYVHVGESISISSGDYSPQELLAYRGVLETQRYLTYKMATIYREAAKIVPVHFEVIVASMTQAMIVSTKDKSLRVGQYVSMHQLYSHNKGAVEMKTGDGLCVLGDTVYKKTIVSIKSVPLISPNALSGLAFENVCNALSRSIILGLEDDLEAPITRMMVGLAPKLGTYYDTFMKERSAL